MGKNKLAKFADLETYPHVFQMSSSMLRGGVGFPLKGKWNSEFFKNDNPIVLELGCGKGEYTVGLARLFPDKRQPAPRPRHKPTNRNGLPPSGRQHHGQRHGNAPPGGHPSRIRQAKKTHGGNHRRRSCTNTTLP